MAKMIDLGRKDSCCIPACCDSSGKDSKKERVYYPTLYISGIKGLDLDLGKIKFTATGKVVSTTERKSEKGNQEEYSCEIEVQAIQIDDFGASLDDAMDKISAKKSKKYEEDEE